MNTRGWYTFEDGYYAWFAGLKGQERKIEIMHHGRIVKFEPTAQKGVAYEELQN